MLVIFDLDDTLIDHTTAYRGATDQLRHHIGSPLPLDEFMALWSAAHRRYFDRFLLGDLTYEEQSRARLREVVDASLTDAQADWLFARYIDAYQEAWSLFPDVEPCLQGLTRHRLAVVSNGHREQQVQKLVRTGIRAQFDHVVVPADCGRPKPHAEIFHHACAIAGELPGRTAYVGDAYDLDAVAARRAGLIGVWLARDGATPSHQPPVIHSLTELPALLDKLEADASRSAG